MIFLCGKATHTKSPKNTKLLFWLKSAIFDQNYQKLVENVGIGALVVVQKTLGRQKWGNANPLEAAAPFFSLQKNKNKKNQKKWRCRLEGVCVSTFLFPQSFLHNHEGTNTYVFPYFLIILPKNCRF